jgi:hypothetical protein
MRTVRPALLTCVLMGALLATGVSPSAATYPDRNGRIVFSA